jgi:hypothetical protein
VTGGVFAQLFGSLGRPYLSKCISKWSYTKDCISVAESHRWCDGGHLQGGRKGLDDAGMETRGSGGNGERIVQSLAGGRPQTGRRHVFRMGLVFDGLWGKCYRSQEGAASAAEDKFGYREVLKESDEDKKRNLFARKPALTSRQSACGTVVENGWTDAKDGEAAVLTAQLYLFCGDNAARREGRGYREVDDPDF